MDGDFMQKYLNFFFRQYRFHKKSKLEQPCEWREYRVIDFMHWKRKKEEGRKKVLNFEFIAEEK